MKRGAPVALVLLGVLAACGGGARPASAPSGVEPGENATAAATTPGASSAPMPPTQSTDADGVPGIAPKNPTPVPPPPSNGTPPPTPYNPPDARRSWALVTLGDSERQIEAGLKECGTACRALASMERAAKSLCELGDHAECERAKARVDAAREKVRKSCGACANGPSVTPGAPIPSSP